LALSPVSENSPVLEKDLSFKKRKNCIFIDGRVARACAEPTAFVKRLLVILASLLLLGSCSSGGNKEMQMKNATVPGPVKFYSKTVNDTFYINISEPSHNQKQGYSYPVVYILDANLHFDILATAIKKYSELGMFPPVILVGIGYRNFQTMDSLRSRDLTYPLAIPEYEMNTSGKADKFLSFITTELAPEIDRKYATNKNARILAGHSLGGYFTVYALQQNLLKKNRFFCGYIAASPSTHYNNNYILSELEKLSTEKQSQIKSYITFGGLENEEDSTILRTDEVLLSLSRSLKNKVDYTGEEYSHLGHMETPFPTFIKGLQWMLEKED
jgi:predicted alpha/beta superfamily hydrolase